MFSRGIEKYSGTFSRGIEKEQWYVFKGYRKRAVVCFQEV